MNFKFLKFSRIQVHIFKVIQVFELPYFKLWQYNDKNFIFDNSIKAIYVSTFQIKTIPTR